MGKIFEIRIASIENMSEGAKRKVISEVSKKSKDFKNNFQGFAKITYVTASPKKIDSIEPIEGTIVEYFRKNKKEDVEIPTF